MPGFSKVLSVVHLGKEGYSYNSDEPPAAYYRINTQVFGKKVREEE